MPAPPVWGPNAAGKTSLLEAIALLGWGRSHRTSADGELIRWGRDLARVEGPVGDDVLEVAIQRSGADGSGGRKRIRVNGVARRASALGRRLRVVLFAPEEMLLVVGSPSLRRAAIDALAAARFPAYADDLGTYGRTLQQRNSLLRAIREETASRDELRFWDETFLDTGGRVVAARHDLLAELARAPGRGPSEIAPDEACERRPDAALRDERADARRGDATRRAGAAARRDGREGGLERLDASSARIATTWPSTSPGAISPGSPRAASSGRRSSPSSSPSSTC